MIWSLTVRDIWKTVDLVAQIEAARHLAFCSERMTRVYTTLEAESSHKLPMKLGLKFELAVDGTERVVGDRRVGPVDAEHGGLCNSDLLGWQRTGLYRLRADHVGAQAEEIGPVPRDRGGGEARWRDDGESRLKPVSATPPAQPRRLARQRMMIRTDWAYARAWLLCELKSDETHLF